jgi:hypothetical protein
LLNPQIEIEIHGHVNLDENTAKKAQKLSKQRAEMVKNYFSWGWWRYWFIATTVVLIFIVSSIGFDVKGHIMTAIEYLSDPEFWTGQLWWVGISFLLLIIIFFYATFKSLFSGIGDGLTNTVEGNDGGN